MDKIRNLIYDELEGLFHEYYIDYNEKEFRSNYASFVDGVIANNGIEKDDNIEDSVIFMVINDLLTLLRNMSE